MSEFMKAVVTEALQRNRPKQDGPIDGGVLASGTGCVSRSKADCIGACGKPQSCIREMPAIHRPNYQREKTAQRLATLTGIPRTLPQATLQGIPQETSAGSTAFDVKEPATPVTRHFVEQMLSPLLRQTLARPPQAEHNPVGAGERQHQRQALHVERQPAQKQTSHGDWLDVADTAPPLPAAVRPNTPTFRQPSASLPPLPNSAMLLGTAADNSWTLWFFPTIREELRALLGVTNRRYRSIGLAVANRCTAAQLFAVDELFNQNPALEIELQWSADADKPFELRLYGASDEDVALIEHKLRELSDRLTSAHPFIHLFVAIEPSPLLMRYLTIRRQDAVAVVSGLCRLNGIGLFDRLLARNPELKLQIYFTAHQDLVLTGTPDAITYAAQELRKEVGLLDGRQAR